MQKTVFKKTGICLKQLLYLLQSVKCDRHVLQLTRVSDEGKDGISTWHPPQLLVHLGPVAEEIVHSALSYNLQKNQQLSVSGFTNIKNVQVATRNKTKQQNTNPGGKVILGFKVRGDLCTLLLQRVITEVSLESVTCQLEIHFLLLTTLRA